MTWTTEELDKMFEGVQAMAKAVRRMDGLCAAQQIVISHLLHGADAETRAEANVALSLAEQQASEMDEAYLAGIREGKTLYRTGSR